MTSPVQGEVPYPRHPRSAVAGPKTMTDLLTLADPERSLVNWLLRQRGASLDDILAHTQAEPAAVEAMLDSLMAMGFLTLNEDTDPGLFKPTLVSRKPRALPEELWKTIE